MKIKYVTPLFLLSLLLVSCSFTSTSFKNNLILMERYMLTHEHLTSEKPEIVNTDTIREWRSLDDVYFDNIYTRIFRNNENDPFALEFTFLYPGMNHDTEIESTPCSYYLNLDEFGQSGDGEITFYASEFIGEEDVVCPLYLRNKYALLIDVPGKFLKFDGEPRTLEYQLW